MFSSLSDEWETPDDLFNELNKEFNFTLDPCATHENHKCNKYYTKEDDGLSKDWSKEVVFMNPPYSRAEKPCKPNCKKSICIRRGYHIDKYKPGQEDWIRKAYEEYKKGATVVMLLPARTDTEAFHKYIYKKATEIRFLKGRLKFKNRLLPSWNEDGNYKVSPAPFPSMIVIYKNKR